MNRVVSLFPVALALATQPGTAQHVPADPYWPGLDQPKLITPQWIGEEGVKAVVILSIDDMSDTGKYERFLRPILDRLKKIDGRAPVSITTMGIDPMDQQVQSWLKEGVSIESHTMSHPCPLLAGGDFAKAKSTVNRNIDLLFTIPNTEPVAFRMPCCDSQNSVSPRFFAEIMHRTTEAGNFLRADSSVFNLFTPEDTALPRELIAPEGAKKGRLAKYLPLDRGFVNVIENYPYPYVIGNMSWQIPGAVPSDWAGQHHHGSRNPKTVEDWKAGIDCTVIKQGVFALVFHPHGWVDPAQVVELIDHCVAKHGKKVKFLTLRETYQRLRDNALGGWTLRDDAGDSTGIQVRDLDQDGFIDVWNPKVGKARRWNKKTGEWMVHRFPRPGDRVPEQAAHPAALRLVDLDGDGDQDKVFSDVDEFWVKIQQADKSWKDGLSGKRGDRDPVNEIPMIVRKDGSDNGAWFAKGWMYIQNEHTGNKPGQVERRILEDFLQPLPARKDLQKLKPRSPRESLQSMRTHPALEIELVAAEPLVKDPVEIAWGPDGKLWVVEMADYPRGMDGKGKSGGRVRFLEDTDGDGEYDKSTLFLEGLNYPTGVLPWRGGVLITAAPEILWARDTDGDGKADEKKVLYDGFRVGNPQHRVNGLRWGLDNWIHIANGDSDGTIRSVKTGKTINISGRDLRIRPDEGLLEAQSGETQFGRCRDDWGNWFGNNNSNALWHYVLRDHYLRRNPHVASPRTYHMVPEEQGRLQLYPTSVTVERFNDFNTANRVTSTCGTGIYRDTWLGEEFYGNAFICEPVHNLVIRQVLSANGLTFSSRRGSGEERREFLSSSDNWFRPVTAKTGPDGALYIVDMYRHVIEHPEWIPKRWQARLNLRSGEDKGRIYRLVRPGVKRGTIPRLDKLETGKLVYEIGSSNGELRDMVHIEMMQRADRDGLSFSLRSVSAVAESPAVRIQALAALDGMGGIMEPGFLHRLEDPHPDVRRQAVRIAERIPATPALLQALAKLLDDPDVRVRHQLYTSLGNVDSPEAEALLELACRKYEVASDPHGWSRAGLLSSVRPSLAARILAAGQDGLPGELVRDLTATAKGNDEAIDPVQVVRVVAESERGGGPPPKAIAAQLVMHAAAEKLTGQAGKGRALFGTHCIACHRLQGEGIQVGPDLTALTELSFGSLLTAIVDPNAAVEDKFVMHTVTPRKGLAVVGCISSETSTAIFLKLADGSPRILLKKDLREIKSMGRSLMAEGFGASLKPQDIADLIRYLQTVRPPPKEIAGNDPQLVKAAPDGSLALRAASAAIYGPRLTYGLQFKMLEWWESEQDFAVWSLECRKAGNYRVEADIACETRVENRFQVIGPQGRVSAVVPQTKSWADFQRKEYGILELREGRQEIVVRSEGPVKNFLMDLQAVYLTPVE